MSPSMAPIPSENAFEHMGFTGGYQLPQAAPTAVSPGKFGPTSSKKSNEISVARIELLEDLLEFSSGINGVFAEPARKQLLAENGDVAKAYMAILERPLSKRERKHMEEKLANVNSPANSRMAGDNITINTLSSLTVARSSDVIRHSTVGNTNVVRKSPSLSWIEYRPSEKSSDDEAVQSRTRSNPLQLYPQQIPSNATANEAKPEIVVAEHRKQSKTVNNFDLPHKSRREVERVLHIHVREIMPAKRRANVTHDMKKVLSRPCIVVLNIELAESQNPTAGNHRHFLYQNDHEGSIECFESRDGFFFSIIAEPFQVPLRQLKSATTNPDNASDWKYQVAHKVNIYFGFRFASADDYETILPYILPAMPKELCRRPRFLGAYCRVDLLSSLRRESLQLYYHDGKEINTGHRVIFEPRWASCIKPTAARPRETNSAPPQLDGFANENIGAADPDQIPSRVVSLTKDHARRKGNRITDETNGIGTGKETSLYENDEHVLQVQNKLASLRKDGPISERELNGPPYKVHKTIVADRSPRSPHIRRSNTRELPLADSSESHHRKDQSYISHLNSQQRGLESDHVPMAESEITPHQPNGAKSLSLWSGFESRRADLPRVEREALDPSKYLVCEFEDCGNTMTIRPWTHFSPHHKPMCTNCTLAWLERPESKTPPTFAQTMKQLVLNQLAEKRRLVTANKFVNMSHDAPVDHPDPLPASVKRNKTWQIVEMSGAQAVKTQGGPDIMEVQEAHQSSSVPPVGSPEVELTITHLQSSHVATKPQQPREASPRIETGGTTSNGVSERVGQGSSAGYICKRCNWHEQLAWQMIQHYQQHHGLPSTSNFVRDLQAFEAPTMSSSEEPASTPTTSILPLAPAIKLQSQAPATGRESEDEVEARQQIPVLRSGQVKRVRVGAEPNEGAAESNTQPVRIRGVSSAQENAMNGITVEEAKSAENRATSAELIADTENRSEPPGIAESGSNEQEAEEEGISDTNNRPGLTDGAELDSNEPTVEELDKESIRTVLFKYLPPLYTEQNLKELIGTRCDILEFSQKESWAYVRFPSALEAKKVADKLRGTIEPASGIKIYVRLSRSNHTFVSANRDAVATNNRETPQNEDGLGRNEPTAMEARISPSGSRQSTVQPARSPALAPTSTRIGKAAKKTVTQRPRPVQSLSRQTTSVNNVATIQKIDSYFLLPGRVSSQPGSVSRENVSTSTSPQPGVAMQSPIATEAEWTAKIRAIVPLRIVKKKYPVPAVPPGVVFYRTLSKRELVEGELLSESDDDVDESALIAEHHALTDRELVHLGIEHTERNFVKRLNEHIWHEKITHDGAHYGALQRFIAANGRWMHRKQGRRQLFFKVCDRFNAWGTISGGQMKELRCMLDALKPLDAAESDHSSDEGGIKRAQSVAGSDDAGSEDEHGFTWPVEDW